MLLLVLLGGIKVIGGVAFLFVLFVGGEANISGSIGPKSVRGGSLSKGDEGGLQYLFGLSIQANICF